MLQNKTIEDFLSLQMRQTKDAKTKTKISQELFCEVKKILIEDKDTSIESIWLETCETRGWSHNRNVTQIDNLKRTEKVVTIRVKGETPPATLKTLFSTFKKVGDDILTFENVKDVIKLANSLRNNKSKLEIILRMVNKLSRDELKELKETLK